MSVAGKIKPEQWINGKPWLEGGEFPMSLSHDQPIDDTLRTRPDAMTVIMHYLIEDISLPETS